LRRSNCPKVSGEAATRIPGFRETGRLPRKCVIRREADRRYNQRELLRGIERKKNLKDTISSKQGEMGQVGAGFTSNRN